MPERPIVILHGWSDTSASFEPLKSLLEARLPGQDVSIISLANYISMEDEVRFDDVASAMETAWDIHNLPKDKGSVDAIVHSTGGLVIRDWLQRYYEPGNAPIKHLVMLAPANFGSPLAHKGRSFLGGVWKGFFTKQPEGEAFETGTQILKGLELASPYTWRLAERDRFGEGGEMYQPGNVLCTVLVGNTGYRGISAIANEDGSDGTVRISTANMECVRIYAEFPANPDEVGHDVNYIIDPSSGTTAFGVMNGHDHSSIKLSHVPSESLTDHDGVMLSNILKALTIEDEQFEQWCDELEKRNNTDEGFQNTVVRVVDQYGVGVDDYLLEFYEKDDDVEDTVAETFHTSAIRGVHKYSDDASYRSVYVDCTRLRETIDKVDEHLSVSVTAYPEMSERTPAGFKTLGSDGIGGIRIKHDDIKDFFVPHRTAFVTLQLTRQQLERTFRFQDHSNS
ncbi:MAG: hypothetical protein J4F48_07725 [Nitrospinae bacterium]|nr:hypothetical protein [Nitrospinota bacterium]